MQFERVGYFCVDPDSRPGALVYNRTIGLRDSWAAKQGGGQPGKPGGGGGGAKEGGGQKAKQGGVRAARG